MVAGGAAATEGRTKMISNEERDILRGMLDDTMAALHRVCAQRDDLAKEVERLKSQPRRKHPQSVQMLCGLLASMGWSKVDVGSLGECVWAKLGQSDHIRIMDPAWFDDVNTPSFLRSVFRALGAVNS